MTKKPTSLADYMQQRPRLTHATLAKKLGVSRPYVTLLIAGDRQPSLTVALRIHALTGVPVAALVSEAVAS